MTPALSVDRISKSFRRRGRAARSDGRGRRFQALEDISFNVPRGETLGVVGANGSGKTTLLKILAGVMQPDAGSFHARGRLGALLEVGAGFHPELTGVENVYLSAAVLGLRAGQTRDFLARIIEFAELERFMDMPIKHYSSGMVVRLGFAIAAQLQPDILLLDETFAVGDARFQARAIGRIREMQAAGVTILMVSHNAALLLDLAGRAIWLDGGQLVQEGDPRSVILSYARAHDGALALEERFRRALTEGPEALPEPEDAPPVRIAGVRYARRPDGETLELASRDALELDVQLAIKNPNDLEDVTLNVFFLRDDGQVLSRARPVALLPSIPVEPGECSATVRLAFEPIALCHGEYRVATALARESGGAWRSLLDRCLMPAPFRIVTPLPHDFRLVGEIPARWEARASSNPAPSA